MRFRSRVFVGKGQVSDHVCIGMAAGTFDDHYHTLLAWMIGGGPSGSEYTPQHVAANCVAQVRLRFLASAQPLRATNRAVVLMIAFGTLFFLQMEYLTTMTCNLPPNPKPCALRHDFQLCTFKTFGSGQWRIVCLALRIIYLYHALHNLRHRLGI